MTAVGDSELVDVTIAWAGGHQTHSQAIRPVARYEQLSYLPRLLNRITTLTGDRLSNREIADGLNAEGLRPPKRTAVFTGEMVGHLILRYGLRPRGQKPRRPVPLAEHEWTVRALADRLDMPDDTIYTWIYRGWATARKDAPTRSWIITADPGELLRLRSLHQRPAGHYTKARWQAPVDPHTTEEGP